jgi:spore germination protein (amino acid permease)
MTEIMFTAPRSDAELLGPAVWHGYLIRTLLAMAAFLILSRLMDRFPGHDLVFVYKKVFGNVAGSTFSLLLGAAFLFQAIRFTREFSEAIKVYVYSSTPPSFIMIFFLFAVLVILYFGFETVARTSALFLLPVLFGYLLIYILGFPLYKYCNLFPVLGFGMSRDLTFSIENISFFGESLSLAVILSSLQGNKYFKNSGLRGIAISGLFTAAGTLAYTMAFSYPVGLENVIPAFSFTSVIELGTFFQRFDSVFLFIWSIGAMVTVAIDTYIFLSIYCKVFKINDHKPLVLPMGILIFSAGIMVKDLSTLSFVIIPFFRKYAGIIYFGLPLLALLFAAIRRQNEGAS